MQRHLLSGDGDNMTPASAQTTGLPDIEGCQCLATVDLASARLLESSQNTTLHASQLTELCRSAADMLSGELAHKFAPLLDQEGRTGPQHAIVLQPHDVTMFLRKAAPPDQAVICVAPIDTDLGRLMTELSTIAGLSDDQA